MLLVFKNLPALELRCDRFITGPAQRLFCLWALDGLQRVADRIGGFSARFF